MCHQPSTLRYYLLLAHPPSKQFATGLNQCKASFDKVIPPHHFTVLVNDWNLPSPQTHDRQP